MPKTKFKVRKVKSKEDRKRPSVFQTLKTDEFFKAHALFEPDPELENNPGFLEYYRHWDQQANQEVPCVGDKCAFCAANDNPGTVALSLWYGVFPKAGDDPVLKVFRMNYSTTQDAADISEEEEGIIGKHFRVKRLSDKGEYRLRPTSEKKLTKKQIEALLKDAPDLEEIVARSAKIQMERLAALEALEDDDDEIDDEDDEDEEEEKSSKKTRKGKAVEEDDDEDEDDEDDDEDEDEDEDEEDDDEDENDEDDDEDEDDEDEDEDDDDEDENESLDAVDFEVVKFQEKDEVFTLKNKDHKKLEAWLGEGVDAPDDIKKGMKVTVTAIQDDEADWVITAIKKKGGRGRPKGSKNKK